MCPLVLNEGGALTEAFPTLLALIGLLTGVDSLVFEEVRALSESLLAAITFIRFVFLELPLGLKKPQSTVHRAVRLHCMAFDMETLFVVIPTLTVGTQSLCCLDVLTKDRTATVLKFISFRVPFLSGHTNEKWDSSASLLFRRTLELQQYSSFWQLFFPVLRGVTTFGKCWDLSLGHFL